MPEGNNIEYIVTDEYSQDVINGLKLFHELTYSGKSDNYLKKWSYWFLQNPFGKGLFSLAKYGDKTVGICALIPVQMLIDNTIIKGAKAEFLGISHEYRKFKKKTPTSISVATGLYKKSFDYGFNFIFGIATPNALIVHKFAGAVTMDTTVNHYVTIFKPTEILKKKNYKSYILKYGAYGAAGILRRNPFYISSSASNLHSMPDGLIRTEGIGKNELIFPSKEMLKFRFTENDFIFYETGNGKYLAFNKPAEDSHVFLRHWSSLDIEARKYNSIFKDLFQKCKKAGARSIQMIITDEPENGNPGFTKFGFLHQKKIDTLMFYHSNNKLMLDLNPSAWHLTDLHRGFI